MKKNYDFLIVGSGLYGAVCANELKKAGKKILVIEKRSHIGGNIFTENINGIHVHKYGAHIFHTNDKEIWDYVNNITEFNRFTNSPLATYEDKLYNLPFNMNTFYQLWGESNPDKVKQIIKSQTSEFADKEPKNLEDKALSLVGRDIYEKLIKGYTEKQWGREAKELPAFIIQRIPVRFTFDNNYFNDKYQGIPEEGYTVLIEKLLDGVEVLLDTDYLLERNKFDALADKVIYTGPIDAFYDYAYGALDYRSLKFNTNVEDVENFQGVAVVNYTDKNIPYTRIIEHKHFNYISDLSYTVVTKEYPVEWKPGDEPYYPINDEKNMVLFKKYKKLTDAEQHIYFGGRLAEYKYYDMHMVIRAALNKVNKIIEK